ncbi:MAG: hypothetical protein Ct9H300mP9_3350 [Candidatus Neomarinimicrobiota bacterium]|nr:MAG: hypothetical protein Ct9H300mP9_3350 [Candidatus Neomarinimicrobiota bacterium]
MDLTEHIQFVIDALSEKAQELGLARVKLMAGKVAIITAASRGIGLPVPWSLPKETTGLFSCQRQKCPGSGPKGKWMVWSGR